MTKIGISDNEIEKRDGQQIRMIPATQRGVFHFVLRQSELACCLLNRKVLAREEEQSAFRKTHSRRLNVTKWGQQKTKKAIHIHFYNMDLT